MHTKNGLRTCKAQSRIWTTKQLRSPHGTWLQRDELSRWHCSLTVEEYSSLTSWMKVGNSQPTTTSATDLLVNDAALCHLSYDGSTWQQQVCTSYILWSAPACIRGRQVALLDGVQVEMECLPDDSVSREQLLSEISDAQLVQHLCRSRAVFSFTADGTNYCQVECLTPYNPVLSEVQASDSE